MPTGSKVLADLQSEAEERLASIGNAFKTIPLMLLPFGSLFFISIAPVAWPIPANLASYIAATVLGTLAGLGLGMLAERWWQRTVANWRPSVRRKLLDGGLLRLVLEHDPHERLPRLVPKWRNHLFGKKKEGLTGSLGERLRQLAKTYQHCCEDAGLGKGGDGKGRLLVQNVSWGVALVGAVAVQAVRFLHLPFNENWAKLLVWIGLAGLLTSALQAIARAIAVMLETASILGKGEPTQD